MCFYLRLRKVECSIYGNVFINSFIGIEKMCQIYLCANFPEPFLLQQTVYVSVSCLQLCVDYYRWLRHEPVQIFMQIFREYVNDAVEWYAKRLRVEVLINYI